MFSKISRYRKLDDIVAKDHNGRELEFKSIRIIDNVEGMIEHTIEDSDRLDHLGYKYYKQSRHWWRICDANPDYQSPFELLGKTPLQICRIALHGSEEVHPYPWNDLKSTIMAIAGVEDVLPEENISQIEAIRSVGSQNVLVKAEKYQRTVVIYYNSHITSHTEIAEHLSASGYVIDEPAITGRTGKTLVIPRVTSL